MILLAFGTRPEFIKIQPLIMELDKNNIDYQLLFTGQHEDLLKDIEVDQKININKFGNRLDSVVGSIMNNIIFHNIDYVLVQGDTSSVLAVALSAFHHQIPVIHLEAGLRTFDKENPYPEEINRQLVSRIADYHLCPTTHSYKNLWNEGIINNRAVVGNTALDNLLEFKDKCEYRSNNILITLHRRENHHWMKEWFQTINEIALKYEYITFTFPVHPNPNVQKCKKYIDAPNVVMIDPLEHNELLNILVKSRLVITDSGGIQEEASFFNKICLTCRKLTERPEAINKSTILVESPLHLSDLFTKFINNYNIDYKSPFGDGHAAEKIIEQFKIWNIS